MENWRISADGRRFFVFRDGHVSITFDNVAVLLINDPEALKSVLEKVASEATKKVGNNHPLVIALETMIGTHFPPPIAPQGSVSETKPPQPFDKGDGY